MTEILNMNIKLSREIQAFNPGQQEPVEWHTVYTGLGVPDPDPVFMGSGSGSGKKKQIRIHKQTH